MTTAMTSIPSLRNFRRQVYFFNALAFETYCSLHREHQVAAIAAANLNNRGQIISPCGTGKTRIQASLHVGAFIQAHLSQQLCVNVIASHRLALNKQLLDAIVDLMVKCGIQFDILYVGSDRPATDEYYNKYAYLGYSSKLSTHLATLSSEECKSFIAQAKANNRQVLVVSTYNSIDRLADVGVINLITHDEAHNTVRTDFNDNIYKIKPNVEREYYFTATRKVKVNDGGMDDESFYGSIIIDVKPQIMLERGEIACPRIHIVRGTNYEKANAANRTMIVKSIVEAYTVHKEHVKKDSVMPTELGAKVIIGAASQQDMLGTYDDSDFKAFAVGIPAFAISSDGAYYNWRKVSTTEFFTHLNALKDGEDAIIFHVDMLTEGIDLPSITGVMPLRDLKLDKLIQLLGRALRLHTMDRTKLYDGTLSPGDNVNYIKPYGHLIIPEHLSTVSEYDMMKHIIRSVYNEYMTPVETLVIVEKYTNNTPNDLRSMLEPEVDDGKRFAIDHEVLDIVAATLSSVIDEERRHMTPQEKIAHVLKLCKETNGTATA